MKAKIMTGIAVALLFGVLGLMVYDTSTIQEYTVVVDLYDNEDPFIALPELASTDAKFIEIRELDKSKNTYKLKIRSREKNLDRFQQSLRVQTAELQ